MNPAWASTLAVALAAAAAGLVAWRIAGAAWGWAVVALILALRAAYHAKHLDELFRWMRQPTLETLPEGAGVWEEVLADCTATSRAAAGTRRVSQRHWSASAPQAGHSPMAW